MKPTRIVPFILAVILSVVSACSAPAVPTMDAVSIKNTAIAAAFTIIAETQAAIRTLTSIPPTETPTQTPLPTNTPILLVTETPATLQSLEATITATLAPSAGGTPDPCNAPLQSISGGDPTKIKIENSSGAPITVSLYLNKTPFGDCGYRGYTIGKGGSILITDLVQGCYNVSVYINDPKKPTKSFGYGCINNPDKWTFIVSRESVSFQGR